MNEIILPLTKGYSAIIDACDEHLAKFKWTAQEKPCNSQRHGGVWRVYAYRMVGRKHLSLHREILLPSDGLDIDHIDGDSLNNRRSNLRVCTRQQNMMNRPPVSGYKGVRQHPARQRRKRFQARLCHKSLGYYLTAEEAAIAYDKAAFAEFGEFSWLNRDNFDI